MTFKSRLIKSLRKISSLPETQSSTDTDTPVVDSELTNLFNSNRRAPSLTDLQQQYEATNKAHLNAEDHAIKEAQKRIEAETGALVAAEARARAEANARIAAEEKIKAETTDASKFLDEKWLAEHYF